MTSLHPFKPLSIVAFFIASNYFDIIPCMNIDKTLLFDITMMQLKEIYHEEGYFNKSSFRFSCSINFRIDWLCWLSSYKQSIHSQPSKFNRSCELRHHHWYA
ncbi:hypothetical protein BCEN4_740157 [Burkholderia cenocepacia]|nr:hypothetical protein BCEN4_740157 [Burkholderia cenocepacia]